MNIVKKMIVLVLTLLLFSITASAFIGNVDFSGEWRLDKEITDLSGSQLFLSKITIIHDENNLTTTRTYENEYGEQYPFDETFTIGGKESEIVIYEMPRKTSASWSEDGKSVIINSTTKYYGNSGEEEFTVIETWSLKEKGSLLSVEFTSSSSYGESTGTYFFKK